VSDAEQTEQDGHTLSEDEKYEAENQKMLAHNDADEITVVRNAADGKIINAVATYADGETEILYHVSLRDLRVERVHAISSRRPA